MDLIEANIAPGKLLHFHDVMLGHVQDDQRVIETKGFYLGATGYLLDEVDQLDAR